MSWSTVEMARLAGVSSRTLRHYDAIGLLVPARVADSGWRHYEEEQLLRLQQILLLRSLGLGLREIAEIVERDRREDTVEVLRRHRRALLAQRQQLERRIATVDRTIADLRAGRALVPETMFDGFEHVPFTFSATDDTEISAYRWEPEHAPRALVQLAHGMADHALRYAELAATLSAHGYAVYAHDQRAHGATAASSDALGRLGADGWDRLVEDIGVLVAYGRTAHPGVPLVLAGHSMGSFAVQQYLLEHSDRVDAAVLTGTIALDLLEPDLDLDAPLDRAVFNAPFAPVRTEYDWLSRDEAIIDAFAADARCGTVLDPAAVKAMFAGARALADPTRMAAVRGDLPLYVAVGDADPLHGELTLVEELVERYRRAGVEDVTVHAYPGARHDIFHETNRDEVVADLLTWLEQAVVTREPT